MEYLELNTDTFCISMWPPVSSLASTQVLNPHSLCSRFTSLRLMPRMPRFSYLETFLHAFLLPEVTVSAPHEPGISKNPISVEMPISPKGLPSLLHLSCPVSSMILSQCSVCVLHCTRFIALLFLLPVSHERL